MAEYERDSFYVADKYNLQAEPDNKKQFAIQLERVNMDYIDFYLLNGIQDAFAKAMLPEILEAYHWDFVQIQFNYYDWYFGDAKQLYDILTEANIPIMVMEPVHGGWEG